MTPTQLFNRVETELQEVETILDDIHKNPNNTNSRIIKAAAHLRRANSAMVELENRARGFKAPASDIVG